VVVFGTAALAGKECLRLCEGVMPPSQTATPTLKTEVSLLHAAYDIIASMIDDIKKVLKMLEALQDAVTAVKTDVAVLRGGQKTLESGQQALDLKVEAVHAYQQQAHTEIMGHLIDTTDMSDRDHKALMKRVERIEKHLDLPPVK
jgi:hypothetical protein